MAFLLSVAKACQARSFAKVETPFSWQRQQAAYTDCLLSKKPGLNSPTILG
jgi:hypothetical protein